VDPTTMVGCTNLKEMELHLNTIFRKIYRIHMLKRPAQRSP
jgi:hypothetical protein